MVDNERKLTVSDPIVITREIVKRGWSDFEPKLITGLLTGSVAAFVVTLLGMYGIQLTAMQDSYLSVACFFVGGYLTPSAGTAVTRRITNGIREVEQHSGPTLTTVTGPTPVQRATGETVIPDSNRGGAAPVATNPGQDSVTAIINGSQNPDPNSDPTVAYGRGQQFLSRLPSSALTSED